MEKDVIKYSTSTKLLVDYSAFLDSVSRSTEENLYCILIINNLPITITTVQRII